MTTVATVGVIAAGIALLEVALVPGMIIGGAAVLARRLGGSPRSVTWVALPVLVALTIYPNRHLLNKRAGGLSAVEALYYLTALAALMVGWSAPMVSRWMRRLRASVISMVSQSSSAFLPAATSRW